MSAGTAQAQPPDTTLHPRWFLPLLRRLLVIAVLVVSLLATGYEAFEYAAWHMSVDSYTLVTDSSGAPIPFFTESNPQAASAMRQRLNNLPRVPASVLRNPVDPSGGAACVEPLYTGPILDFRYNFYWHGALIETVWSQYTRCGVGWISCGGRTVEVGDLPLLPSSIKAN